MKDEVIQGCIGNENGTASDSFKGEGCRLPVVLIYCAFLASLSS